MCDFLKRGGQNKDLISSRTYAPLAKFRQKSSRTPYLSTFSMVFSKSVFLSARFFFSACSYKNFCLRRIFRGVRPKIDVAK